MGLRTKTVKAERGLSTEKVWYFSRKIIGGERQDTLENFRTRKAVYTLNVTTGSRH